MLYKACLLISMCNFISCSHTKDSIIGKDIDAGHHNHWGAENDHHGYRVVTSSVVRRESPLIHTSSTSIVTPRLDRGALDFPGIPHVTSDETTPDSAHKSKVPPIHVAANIAVKTESKCCNSNCCDDDDSTCRCSIQ